MPTYTKVCRVCGEEKPVDKFGKRKDSRDGYSTRCKECINEYQKRWRLIPENREKHRTRSREIMRRKRTKSTFVEWRNRSMENAEKQRQLSRDYSRRNKMKVLNYYGGIPPQCACCNEGHLDFLTIDHIDGGGYKHRKENKAMGNNFYLWLINNGFPEGYQVLCMNCNWSKRLNNGKCIHMIEKEELVKNELYN